MATLDLSAEIDIEAAPADIAGVMFDPQREPEWMTVVTGVELIDPALTPGARVKRTGSLLGRSIAWTTEVERVHFPHVLTLKVVDGPFRGTVRYDIQRSGTGSRVRWRGQAEGEDGDAPVGAIAGPLEASMAADLARLKVLVEGRL